MHAQAMTEEKIYTVQEVASILRMSAQTIRKMIADGELDAFKVRDEYRITQSALEKVMKRPPRQ